MADVILLLETSGAQCGVAIVEVKGSEGEVLAEAEHKEPMKHTAMLLPLIKNAFAKTPYTLQQTSAVAVSSGPGSYTALRAGYSSAKGLCLALSIPLITVSTLRAAACRASINNNPKGCEIVSVLPARRNDVYFSRYDSSLNTLIEPACVEANAAWWEGQFQKIPTLLVAPKPLEIEGIDTRAIFFQEAATSVLNLLEISVLKYCNKEFSDLVSAEPNYVKPPFITQAKSRF